MRLELQNISIGYNHNALISHINADLKEGDICALLGKNGSGKTTLLKTILKLIPALAGEIKFNETNIANISSKEYATQTAVVLNVKTPSLQMTSKDFLMQGRYPYHSYAIRTSKKDKELLEETISFLQLEDIIHVPVNQLSDGNFQKVSIGRAFMQDTELILFDEPLSHLDVSNQQIILQIMNKMAQEKNKTIIFSSHEWNQSLQIANQLWLLKNQDFISGSSEDLALKEDLISYFTPENYYYDYCFNIFKNKSDKSLQPITVNLEKGNSDAIFWLYKALGKSNFEIVEEAEIEVEVKGNQFKIINKEEVFTTDSIEKLIQKLQS